MQLNVMQNLIKLGTRGVSKEYEDQVIVVNTLSLMTAFLAGTIGTGIALALKDPSIFVAAWLEVGFFSGFLILNYYHHHQFAAVAFLITHNLGILYFGVWRGMVIEEEMLTVFLIITSLLILKKIWQITLSIVFTSTSLFFARINLRTGFIHAERVNDPGWLFHDCGMIALFILIITAISFFKRYVMNLIRQLQASNENLEKTVQQRTAQLESANRNVNLFFRAIVHDINNEIYALSAVNGVIRKEVTKLHLTGNLEELFAISWAASSRVSDITRNILDLRRIESGDFGRLDKKAADFRLWGHELVDSLQLVAHTRLIKITPVIGEMLPPYIKTDYTLLEKAVRNLIGNAIKFTPQGGKIFLNCDIRESKLMIEIIDEGPGIPLEQQLNIFYPYVTEGQQGTGLGLFIVSRTVATLGGTIDVESEPGHGSTFRIMIPYETASSSEITRPAMLSTNFELKITVLVIDDNDLNRTAGKLLLGDLQCNVLLAEDGAKGIAMARQYRPDVIILDACLPDIPGNEVLNIFRDDKDLLDIPVIVATGDRSMSIIEQFHGADDFLFKPFTQMELTSSLSLLMARGGETMVDIS
ncbi:MAG TPA: ATP-binding protein [Chitinophaga sp.]|uniref:hybrid sensor histidine kinase/response regulator n=1 Tax=Chitinophaga sp. TaxID=1869181 RepID=UPI002C704702|nr:ATP-binding protein [Chitinophaga sp.]HVI47126.1 ATP-binding protein [Chitinophaga sp.]